MQKHTNRRSFLKSSAIAAGAATVGVGLLGKELPGSAKEGPEEHSGRLTPGDAALLRFAAAAEILETDFWVQYNELGGIPNTSEVPGGSGNPAYTSALQMLDADMAQYVHDNTDDEFTHQNFLNAYLISKAADPVSLEAFRTLPGSTATGSSGKLRLTNLMQLTLDTSWWTRYRSSTHNPDLDPNFSFPQAIPDLNRGQHTAIPRTDADTSDPNFLQVIANTAGFHFPTIADLNSSPFGGEDFQTNLIMPEPCPFISRKLPPCSVIRPTETKDIAKGVVKFLTDMGLFIGQSPAFFALMNDLAEDADEARRQL